MCLALKLVGSLVELGFSVDMEVMSSYCLMFPGVRSSLMFSGFGVKPSASGFQSYSYSSLKNSLSIAPMIKHLGHFQSGSLCLFWLPLFVSLFSV